MAAFIPRIRLAAACKTWEEQDELMDKTSETTRYYEEFQKREQVRMTARRTTKSGREIVDDHDHGHDENRNVASAALSVNSLSNFEPNTLINSSLCRASTTTKADNLADKFNMMERPGAPRFDLPVHRSRTDILEKIASNPVTVISGSTGCGKSTQIPQFILDQAAQDRKYVNIVVTQPRRLAAQAIAKRISGERNWPLGRLVGYKVGLDKSNASPDTRLLFVTTGVLKKMLISKQSLNDFTHVILDEVHERETDMDFVLILCRKFITSNSPNTKLILMSATLNVEQLCDYFSWPMLPGGPSVTQAGYAEIKGQQPHVVQTFYLDELMPRKSFEGHDHQKPELAPACVAQCKSIIEALDITEDKY